MPGVGAEQPVGLQSPSPQFGARLGEAKDTATQGELHLPIRAGGAGNRGVAEDKTRRPFRIVPRTVGGGGELRLPLPDKAPHVRSPRSAGRDPGRDIDFSRRFGGHDPLPRVERAGKAKRGGLPCGLELPDAQDAFLVGKVRLDRWKRPGSNRIPRKRHVATRPFERRGDMGPKEAALANPDFPHDGLEPAERARKGKEDRAVHKKDLGKKGGGGPFRTRRHPAIVQRAVSLTRFQAEIPDPDPGYGKPPREKTQR
jgi:hypothetical protein